MEDDTAKAHEIARLIAEDPDEARTRFPSPDDLVQEFPPYQQVGVIRPAVLAAKGASVPFTVKEYDAAMSRWANRYRKEQTRLEKEAMKASREQEVEGFLGQMPRNEREYVELMVKKRKLDVTFDRRYLRNGERWSAEDMINDLQLTAADLSLVKPRGNLLAATNIDRAANEWAKGRREERKLVVIERVFQTLDQEAITKIVADLKEVCKIVFVEPAYGSACVRKFMWQVKRRLLGMPVDQLHFFVAVGTQNCGKTTFARNMIKPVGELAAECSVADSIDERQMDLPQMYILFFDEMSRMDRVDQTALKTLITGESPSRRPMRTNITEKIQVNCTMWATSNLNIDQVLIDTTGMRRNVQMQFKPRVEVPQEQWDKVLAFDWTSMWQSIDVQAADPLMTEFKDLMLKKQEEVRSQTNTEEWLRQFDYDTDMCFVSEDDAIESGAYHIEKTSTDDVIQFLSSRLYLLFHQWEDMFGAKRLTSHSMWGREMKQLVNTVGIPGWKREEIKNNTIFTWNRKEAEADAENLRPAKAGTKPEANVEQVVNLWKDRTKDQLEL